MVVRHPDSRPVKDAPAFHFRDAQRGERHDGNSGQVPRIGKAPPPQRLWRSRRSCGDLHTALVSAGPGKFFRVLVLFCQILGWSRKERRPYPVTLPPSEEFERRTADSSLAQSHAAAALQLGLPRGVVPLDLRPRHFCTPADDSIRTGERFQLLSQGEIAETC